MRVLRVVCRLRDISTRPWRRQAATGVAADLGDLCASSATREES
jgi:hypothetical protein